MLAWCLARMASAFRTETRLIVAAPGEAPLARQAASSIGWEVVTSAHWRDVDAWLDAAARLGAETIVAAQLEAALCLRGCWETLEATWEQARPGLAYAASLPAMVSPEFVNTRSAAAIRSVAPDEAATHRFGALFAIAEAAGIPEIDGLPCSVARSPGAERNPGPHAEVRFESARDVEWLRSAAAAEDPLGDFARQRSISIRMDRAALTSPRTRREARARSADRSRRVLFVSNPSAWSGAESSTVALAGALAGRQMETAALVAYRGDFTAHLEAAGCRVYCENREFATTSVGSWLTVASAIADWCPDVLHYCGRSGLLPLQVAAASGVPVVYHGHVPFPAVYREAAEWADRFIGVSASVAEAMAAAGIDPGSVVSISNGVNVRALAALTSERASARRALRLSPDDFVVLALSRLSPEKRLGDLIQAVALARRQGAPAMLLIAGEGHAGSGTEAALRLDVQRLGLGDAVRLLGHVRDVRPLLASADTLALCSDSEGLPMVALEAMAAGIPLIATRTGGLADLVGDPADPRSCGVAVPIGDAGSVAAAIVRLQSDSALHQELAGRAARRAAAEYDTGMMADAVLRVYGALW